MDIANVLTPVDSERTKSEKSQGKDGVDLSGNQLLFALLLQNFCGIQTGVEGQTSEEAADNNSTGGTDNIISGSVGWSSIAPVLQNLFPAGMEVNSGSIGDFTSFPLSDLVSNISNSKDNQLQQGSSLLAQGLKGINSPAANSLDPAELEEYIKIVKYLKELSGQIEVVKDQPVGQGGAKENMATMKNPGNTKTIETIEDTNMNGAKTKENTSNFKSTMVIENTNLQTVKAIKTISTEKAGINKVPSVGLGKTEGNNNSDTVQIRKIDPSSDRGTVSPSLTATQSSHSKGTFTGEKKEEENGFSKNIVAPEQIKSSDNRTDNIFGIEKIFTDKGQAVDSAKVWNQVLEALKNQNLNTKDIKELSIQLEPKDLGKVNISVRMEDGQVHLTFNASEQSTGLILQNSLQELKNSLSQLGVACGNLQMGNNNGNDQSASGRNNYRYKQGAKLALQEEENTVSTVFTSYLPVSWPGHKINVSA